MSPRLLRLPVWRQTSTIQSCRLVYAGTHYVSAGEIRSFRSPFRSGGQAHAVTRASCRAQRAREMGRWALAGLAGACLGGRLAAWYSIGNSGWLFRCDDARVASRAKREVGKCNAGHRRQTTANMSRHVCLVLDLCACNVWRMHAVQQNTGLSLRCAWWLRRCGLQASFGVFGGLWARSSMARPLRGAAVLKLSLQRSLGSTRTLRTNL